MAELLVASGTGTPWTDEEGNVLAWFGDPGARPLVLSAHLDTVFPAEQEIRIRREGEAWVGPGVSDDARGLAVLLAAVRALKEVERGGLPLKCPVLLAASVGEEGVGDLRGVRHLFGPAGAGSEARGFISLDGAGIARVISVGVGSRRFRVELRGPGGHSWADYGRVNPIHVLARSVTELQDIPLPPRSTLHVGRIHGGTSVNAIPTDTWLEFELRSEDEAALESLEARATGTLERVLAAANREARGDPGRLELTRIGRRPGGSTPEDTVLVRSAVAATRAVAGYAELGASSTDANLPMSLGIPAVTLGAGGEAGDAHTPQEWYRNHKGPEGVLRALLTLLLWDRAES